MTRMYPFAKRFFDVAISGVALIILTVDMLAGGRASRRASVEPV